MSKIDQGPAASSFESPSKVGWLYKHGGSGVSSHWRKRWFVADHHYLFYYKGPNDKKPVGIVCLPDYESCHKAEIKIWKKQHSFMLDRGNTGQENDSSEGTPAKNYVLYADSEDEMQEWIKALSEEIKPMIGEDKYANGFSGGGGGGGKTTSVGTNFTSSSSGSSKGKGKKGKGGGGEPGVDDKALDKVTALAGEGPKLTHLTASRPKVPRGRRPPKRYAVFHEDDSKPEESPPATPDLSKPSDPSPTSSPSPSDSPAPKKKGHKPMVALLPSRAASVKVSPKTPPIPPAKVTKADSDTNIIMEPESPRETTQKLKFARPTPPKKPLKEKPPPTATIKEEALPEAVPSPEPPSEAPLHTPTATTSHRPPTPPTKPSKEKEPTATTPTPFEKKTENVQQQQQSRGEDDQQTKGAPRPSPVRRQRPQPPVKPRTNTMASTGSAAVSGGSGEGGGTAAPPTATQIAESAVPQPSQQQQQRPVPAKRPVPRKRVVTPQQSPSREAVPTVAAAASAVTKETAALPMELQDQVKKEPPVPAKEMKPQPAAKEVVVSEKEAKAEAEIKTVTTAKAEEPIVPEKEIKPLPPKEPDLLKKEVESAAVKEAVIPEKEAKPETPVVAVEKEEKLLVEGRVEQAAVDLERAVEKPKEKEEKLPPTPFDDIEETDTKVSEPEKIQEEQKQGEDEKDTENMEQQDESKYVYEDMEPGSGEKGDNIPQEEKARTDSEYEIMNFNEEEKAGEKESAVVTTTEEVARQQQQQQQQREAPGKVHQYDQVALDEAEPRFKISSSSSKDFDGTLSSSSGYEHMDPAPAAVRAGDKERESSLDGEYVPMKDGVIIDQEPGEEREGGEKGVATADQTSTDKYEYEEPSEWVEQIPAIIRDASPPYDSLLATRLTPSPGHNRRPDELAPDADVRRSVASSGSVSSQKSLQTSSLEIKGGVGVVSSGEERRRGSSGASRKSSEAGSVQLQPERDGFGYAKVNKIRQPGAKDEQVNSVTSELDRGSSPVPPEIIPMAVPMEDESPQHISPSPSYKTVPETLRQAKEVLRLAQVVKAEAEQMREEARRELNIAKKDRHEATLLKKNAAEILRMAKERLNSVGGK